MDNKELRQKIIQQRKLLSKQEYEQKSKACFEKLLQWDLFLNAKNVGLYVGTFHEVDTKAIIVWLLENKKHVYLPYVLSDTKMVFYEIKSFDDLKPGRFGILAPKKQETEQINMDLLLVPLVAYNLQGKRMGMGGGYYDRFLEKYPMTTCGLAYTFQKAEFEVFSHDHQLHYLINEKEMLTF